jgi:hypothetical protein
MGARNVRRGLSAMSDSTSQKKKGGLAAAFCLALY